MVCLLLPPFDHQSLDVVVEVFQRSCLALLAHGQRLYVAGGMQQETVLRHRSA